MATQREVDTERAALRATMRQVREGSRSPDTNRQLAKMRKTVCRQAVRPEDLEEEECEPRPLPPTVRVPPPHLNGAGGVKAHTHG